MIDWEENVFIGLKALYQRVFTRPKERQQAAVRATLKEHRGSLLYLGRMLSGRDLTLFETDDPTFCTSDRIFLPKQISIGPTVESNHALYELRTIIGALAIRNRWTDTRSSRREEAQDFQREPDRASSRRRLQSGDKVGRVVPRAPLTNRDDEELSQDREFAQPKETSEDRAERRSPPSERGQPRPQIQDEQLDQTQPSALKQLLASCYDEFPGLPEKIDSLERTLGLNGGFWDLLGKLPEAGSTGVMADKDSFDVTTPDATNSQTVTEIEGRGQSDVEVLPESALEGSENNMPEHVFEKTETIEEHSGMLRKSDDEEMLEENEEALREVDMKHLVRTPERPRSIYRADVMLDGLCFETDDDAPSAGIPYPEWDYRKASYKPDWCFLGESIQLETDPA